MTTTTTPAICPLLDAPGAAGLLQCSVRTVEDCARSGRLPAVKFGDGWLFPADALLRAVNRMAEDEAARRANPPAPQAIKRPTPRKGPPDLSLLLSAIPQ